MKEKLKRMIAEKEAKLAELREKAKKSEDVAELRSLTEDVDAIIAELNALKEMYAEADEPAPDEGGEGAGEGTRSARVKKITDTRGGDPAGNDAAEKRAAEFARSGKMSISTKGDTRAVLVSSGKIATPTQVSGINEGLDAVSSIVDMVNIVDANGMGSELVAYEKADGEADETAEGAAAKEGDPDYGLVELKPRKVTILSYISEEVKTQTPLQYEERVRKQALRALKAKTSSIIVAAVKASEIYHAHTVTSNKIDEKTLRAICMQYGGDETVAGGGVLFLNKADLIAFGDVRGTSEKKPVYEITPDSNNPNTGIIKDGGLSVRYCINKKCTALSTATQGADAIKTMLYGNPLNVQLDLFSDYEVKVSEDYRFAEGMLTIRGAVQLDAALVVDKGFVVVELGASA